MRHIGTLFLLSFLSTISILNAQERRGDTLWDNNLQFLVVEDLIVRRGILEICIYDSKRDICVENLVTGFEVRVFNAKDEEVWNSLWTGRNKRMRFKNPIRDAHYVIIKANGPFVINLLSGSRVYQDQPMELKFFVQR
jgi:hypothetical protein